MLVTKARDDDRSDYRLQGTRDRRDLRKDLRGRMTGTLEQEQLIGTLLLALTS